MHGIGVSKTLSWRKAQRSIRVQLCVGAPMLAGSYAIHTYCLPAAVVLLGLAATIWAIALISIGRNHGNPYADRITAILYGLVLLFILAAGVNMAVHMLKREWGPVAGDGMALALAVLYVYVPLLAGRHASKRTTPPSV